jgi:predicted nucleic acid-binding protein
VKIAHALTGVGRLYIETAPLIYYVETNPRYIDRMDAVVAVVESQPIRAYSSVITLTEVLIQPIKAGNKTLEQNYRDSLVNSGNYQLVPITLAVAESAADLRARYNLRTPDALHVAAALNMGCDAFLTNDVGIKRGTEGHDA